MAQQNELPFTNADLAVITAVKCICYQKQRSALSPSMAPFTWETSASIGPSSGLFHLEGTKFFMWIDTYYVYGFVSLVYITPVSTIYHHGNCHTDTI